MDKDNTLGNGIIKPIYTNKKADPRRVQDEIEKYPQGISAFALAKNLGISYPTCSRICKTLEFADLIKSKITIGLGNRTNRLYSSVHAQQSEEAKNNG